MGEVIQFPISEDAQIAVCECTGEGIGMFPVMEYDEDGYLYVSRLFCLECDNMVHIEGGYIMESET